MSRATSTAVSAAQDIARMFKNDDIVRPSLDRLVIWFSPFLPRKQPPSGSGSAIALPQAKDRMLRANRLMFKGCLGGLTQREVRESTQAPPANLKASQRV